MKGLTTCLWFDNQAEEAARFYCSVFKNARVGGISRYGEAGAKVSGRPQGSVMTVDFEIAGQKFLGLNGGPEFKFSEAISFQVNCATQVEIDYYWEKLTAGGDPKAQQCGWLKDKFGLSWQVVPDFVDDLFKNENSAGASRAMNAMLKMKKIDIAELRRAHG